MLNKIKLNSYWDYFWLLVVIIFIVVNEIGLHNIAISFYRYYNGTTINYPNYSLQLPKNWAMHIDEDNNSIRVFGDIGEEEPAGPFIIDVMKVNYITSDIMKKWSQCDSMTWYPIETYQGKKLKMVLCSFDFNSTTSTTPKPALALMDANNTMLLSSYEWRPFYNEYYLEVFKSLYIKDNSKIHELDK